MQAFDFISFYETSLLTAYTQELNGERRVFENTYTSAVAMLLLFFGVSIAFIILSAYLWMHEQRKSY
jgi:hypothetical protein